MSRLFALLARLSRRFAEYLEATRSIEIALGADRGLTNAGHRILPPVECAWLPGGGRNIAPSIRCRMGGGVDLG